MDIFDFLTMIGGLSIFLFGKSLMGQALERRAGSGLRKALNKSGVCQRGDGACGLFLG